MVLLFLFHLEIEGKGGWIIGRAKWVCCPPPSQIIGGGGGPAPPPPPSSYAYGLLRHGRGNKKDV